MSSASTAPRSEDGIVTTAIPVTADRRLRATLIGGIAVLLWATLALLTTAAQPVPPFQLVALTFGLAFLLGLAKWTLARAGGGAPILSHLRQPAAVWALGVGGLFGYHFFYFTALGNAPAVDASLIAYLWPLLIVLFSALLPGESLRWWHVAGGVAGLARRRPPRPHNAGGGVAFRAEFAFGYLAALAAPSPGPPTRCVAAASAQVPTDAVGGFCGVTALLGLLCHLLFEETALARCRRLAGGSRARPRPGRRGVLLWDYGVKRGDIKALGAFAYATPLLSTAAADRLRPSGGELDAGRLVRAHRRRSRACRQRYVAPALAADGLPARRRHLEAAVLEGRRHNAADEGPVTEAAGGLPAAGRARPPAGRSPTAMSVPSRCVAVRRPSGDSVSVSAAPA